MPDLVIRQVDHLLAERIQAFAKNHQWSINEVLLHALRRGLSATESGQQAETLIRTTAPELDGLIAGARSEVLLQTPYLVLSDPAQQIFRDLRKQAEPPRVVVSTNSLAATDNPIVYALSYKYKRRNLRELGFNIYEYKPFPLDASVDYENLVRAPLGPYGQNPRDNRVIGGSAIGNPMRGSSAPGGRSPARAAAEERGPGSEVDRRLQRTETRPSFLSTKPGTRPVPVTREGARMGLHAKSLVVDRRVGVIGTHNFDPRSENYNTEGAVIMGMIHFLLPYMVLNVYVSLDGIDRNLISAARSLGCTNWQAFKEVTLPLSLPGLGAGIYALFAGIGDTLHRRRKGQQPAGTIEPAPARVARPAIVTSSSPSFTSRISSSG